MSSALEELAKLPTENALFDMNFDNKLVSGETISSISSIVSTNQGLVSGSSNINIVSSSFTDNVVQVRLSAGTSKEQYEVTFNIGTSLTNVLQASGLLRVL